MKAESITIPPKSFKDPLYEFYGYSFTATIATLERKVLIFYHQGVWGLIDTQNGYFYASISGLNEKIQQEELEQQALNLVTKINKTYDLHHLKMQIENEDIKTSQFIGKNTN